MEKVKHIIVSKLEELNQKKSELHCRPSRRVITGKISVLTELLKDLENDIISQ